jgi:pyruvate kinase
VANAVFDGTDAIMLSGETAVGQYPVEAVACMHRIAIETETQLIRSGFPVGADVPRPSCQVDDPITAGACELARQVGARALVTPTLSGRTARMVAEYRPTARVVAVAPSEAVLRRLSLVWGITSVRMSSTSPGTDRLTAAVADACAAGAIEPDERVVVLAGHPIEGGPRFPTLRIVRVGPGGTSEEP